MSMPAPRFNLNDIKDAIRLIDAFNSYELDEMRIIDENGNNIVDFIPSDELHEFFATGLNNTYFIKYKYQE